MAEEEGAVVSNLIILIILLKNIDTWAEPMFGMGPVLGSSLAQAGPSVAPAQAQAQQLFPARP